MTNSVKNKQTPHLPLDYRTDSKRTECVPCNQAIFKITKSYFYFIFLQKFRYSNKFLYISWTLKNYTQLLDAIQRNRMKKGVTLFFKKDKNILHLYVTFNDLHMYYLCTNGTSSMTDLQSTVVCMLNYIGFMDRNLKKFAYG